MSCLGAKKLTSTTSIALFGNISNQKRHPTPLPIPHYCQLHKTKHDWSVPSDSHLKVKVKVKAICGSYNTAAVRHIVLLPE